MKNKSVRKNIKKRLAKLLLYILLVVAIIPFAITLLFQNPLIQTISARLAANILSSRLEQSVSINTISIGFFSGININKLNVKDHHNNTLIDIGNLNAMPIFSNLSFSSINFLTVELDSVQFNMGLYKGDSINNLSYMIKKRGISSSFLIR